MHTRPSAQIEPAAEDAGGLLRIDLGSLAHNWRMLQERAPGAECGAVVKADAYGCGISQVVPALVKAGCRTFFVATIAEGRTARQAAGSGHTIYVLNGFPPGAADALAAADLRPVLSSMPEIEEWRAFLAGAGWGGSAALQIDTGMNRLGVTPAEARELARPSELSPPLSLVMSHFACADHPAHPANRRQIAAFAEVRALFPDVRASLANSSGVFLGSEAFHELLRPGAALYGVNPTPGLPNPMRPVVTLAGRIALVRSVATGEAVGYGATWRARRDSRIAIVTLGYADGLLRAAGSTDHKTGADAIVAGQRCPIAGRVSMDLVAVDVTDVSPEPSRGSLACFLNEDIGIDELAAHAGTIGYEILTGLRHRYHRVYAASPQASEQETS